MNPNQLLPTAIVAYLALFAAAGFIFLFGALLLGRFLRADNPTPEKMETYECGEPPVGSGYLQFNLRYYVIALVFLIFDVEVALFFPWATVFGKANQLREGGPDKIVVESVEGPSEERLTPWAVNKYTELGIESLDATEVDRIAPEGEDGNSRNSVMESDADKLALAALADISVFFGVLLVGFAYVWKQGDLDWVRAVRSGALDDDQTSDQLKLSS